MRKIVFFVFLIVNSMVMFSQTEPQFTQYMLSNSSFNPAAVGEGEMIQISGTHRLNWLGMPNAGQTTIFQINSPVKLFGEKHGVGIKFKNDAVGQFYFQGAYLQYAYKKKISNGVLSAGLDFGFISAGFHGDSIRIPSIGDYHKVSGDPLLQMGETSGLAFDIGLGVWYSAPKFYVGFSYLNLTNPTVSWSDTQNFAMSGISYFTGGYNFKLENYPKYVITPSFLVKTDFTVAQLDLSALVKYDDRIWGGLAYRWKESIGLLAGLEILTGLSLGYSFDLPITQIGGWGSHELILRYEFEYLFGSNKNKHKSVRIL